MSKQIDNYFSKSVFTRRFPSFEEAAAGLELHRERLCRLLIDSSADVLVRPLSPGKWSLAQVADHLILANDAFCRSLQRSVKRGRPAFAMSKGILTEEGKAIAPVEAEPRPDRTRDDLIVDVERTTAALLAETESARVGDSLETPCLVHAFFGELTALECLQLSAWHMEWHLRKLD